MVNNRIIWSVQAVGFKQDGSTGAYTPAHGVQSVGTTTTFNLIQEFELSETSIYENIADVPDVEITVDKVIDGYPLLYHLSTPAATSATLIGRSTEKCHVALSIFPETYDAASGNAIATVESSGMYFNSATYTATVDGSATESITLIGNHRVWTDGGGGVFEGSLFDNTDAPTASGGIQQRENFVYANSILPANMPGVEGSSIGNVDINNPYHPRVQSFTTTVDLARESLFELGTKPAYFKSPNLPAEVSTDIEIISTSGDWISVDETGEEVGGTEHTIQMQLEDGLNINLGSKNRLSNMTYGGGDAGGGNVTQTFSYITFNDFTVTHPQDPAGL